MVLSVTTTIHEQLSLQQMKATRQIYNYTFGYRGLALLTIFCNLFFVIFNLVSILLFIPVLQMIFTPNQAEEVTKPVYEGGFIGFFEYIPKWYNFTMQGMVAEDPKKALVFVCLSVFAAFFLKNVFRYGAIWHQSQLRMAVVRDLKDAMYEKIIRLPMQYFADERKGDLMSKMNNDVGEIENGVIAVLELFFREPFAIITSIIALVVISPKLTLISFILLPITAFVISRIGKSLKRTAKQTQEQNGTSLTFIEETLSGIKVIKSFNAFQFMFERFKKINLRHQQLITKTFRKRDLSPIINETLGAGVMILLVWFGGQMILDQEATNLTGEKFITFIIAFSQLLRPIQGISTSVSLLNKAEPSLHRIQEVLNAPEVIEDRPNAAAFTALQKGISVQHVTFAYKSETVLDDISFNLEKGKVIALVGESGSGKSTIADLLPRFYDIQQGEITFDDVPIKDMKILDLRAEIGIVSQESYLFNDTIYNNILFGMPTATKEQIEAVAKLAHAHEFIEQFPDKYNTIVGERGSKLSGGQRQRISIARALLKNPSILILDEATSALDTESERIVQKALEEVMKDRTALVIAHRLSTIQHADEILVLSKGKVVERGTHSSLISLNGTYKHLCSLQGISE